MSHLLATINPEAADPVAPPDLPEMGEMVIYRVRPGEGRRGKSEFPALVLGANNIRGRTGLDILVCYDANDVIMMDSVQMMDDFHDSSCWRLRGEHESNIRVELARLREEIAALRRAVFGDWNEPEGGLMEYLVDFEKRIKVVEANAAKAQAPTAKKAPKKA